MRFFLAKIGAEVVGIDLSDEAIEQARNRAREEQLNITFHVMNAEDLTFPPKTFDLVCGTGILHHLDRCKAYPELARVLKPGGKAFFVEPLGHNLFINLYRRFTPRLRTEDEHPLVMRDLAVLGSSFPGFQIKFYYLTSLLTIPFRRSAFFDSLINSLNAFDGLIFRLFPFTRKYAWIVMLEFEV